MEDDVCIHFSCPICGMDVDEDSETHMDDCGLIVQVDNVTPNGFMFTCVCGYDALKPGPTHCVEDMIEHLDNTPHDWPKILVEREMRGM